MILLKRVKLSITRGYLITCTVIDVKQKKTKNKLLKNRN